MNISEIKSLFEAFTKMKVLVIGDVMIDAYYEGKVDRISPEAPVPVVHVTRSNKRLGGAANVAQNLAALGATPILCSVIGNDLSATDFLEILKREKMPADGILQSEGRVTTVKTRIISGNQQMLRVDEEEIAPLDLDTRNKFERQIVSIIDNQDIDVIVFEDYDKGVISAELIKAIVTYAHLKDIPVAVDPKKDNFLNYHNVDLFKPNLKELVEGLKIDIDTPNINNVINANLKLSEHLHHKTALITLSENGVFVGSESGAEIIPAHVRKIADVSGAGDTVIAVASLCLGQGIDQHWLAQFSNLAGGLVCEHVGAVPIDKQNLLDECLALCNE